MWTDSGQNLNCLHRQLGGCRRVFIPLFFLVATVVEGVIAGIAGQWNDLDESNRLTYLVEFNEQTDPAGEDSLTSTACPYGLYYKNSAGDVTKAYSWCVQAQAYLSAQSMAKSRTYLGAQGYLAVIEDESENNVIRDWLVEVSKTDPSGYIDELPVAQDGGGAAYVWLGGDDKALEGTWNWRQYPESYAATGKFWAGGLNGSSQSAAYENWGRAAGRRTQPNNYQGNQDALAMALEDFDEGSASTQSGTGTSNSGTVLRIALEEPVQGEIHTGVGNLRGWAVANRGVTKVEILIDGVYAFDIPYGGSRGDVGRAFPDVANSSQSGFSAAFNYSSLAAGQHSITAIAYDSSGATQQSSASFNVVRFNSEFISGNNAVNLSGGVCRTSGDEISVVDAIVSGQIYDLVMKWRTAEQGFEIVEIR